MAQRVLGRTFERSDFEAFGFFCFKDPGSNSFFDFLCVSVHFAAMEKAKMKRGLFFAGCICAALFALFILVLGDNFFFLKLTFSGKSHSADYAAIEYVHSANGIQSPHLQRLIDVSPDYDFFCAWIPFSGLTSKPQLVFYEDKKLCADEIIVSIAKIKLKKLNKIEINSCYKNVLTNNQATYYPLETILPPYCKYFPLIAIFTKFCSIVLLAVSLFCGWQIVENQKLYSIFNKLQDYLKTDKEIVIENTFKGYSIFIVNLVWKGLIVLILSISLYLLFSYICALMPSCNKSEQHFRETALILKIETQYPRVFGKQMDNFSDALYCNLAYNFRNSGNPWETIMRNKYYSTAGGDKTQQLFQ